MKLDAYNKDTLCFITCTYHGTLLEAQFKAKGFGPRVGLRVRSQLGWRQEEGGNSQDSTKNLVFSTARRCGLRIVV